MVAPQHRVEETKIEEVGVMYKIDPQQLIEAVVVSPYSPDWFLNVVQSTLGRFEIDAAVEKSVLQRRPAGEGAWAPGSTTQSALRVSRRRGASPGVGDLARACLGGRARTLAGKRSRRANRHVDGGRVRRGLL